MLVTIATAWAAGHGGAESATGFTRGFGVGFLVAAELLVSATLLAVLLPGRRAAAWPAATSP